MRLNYKYLRLSSEDEMVRLKNEAESNSISSQRLLLDHYISAHPELGTFLESIDDGVSGLSLNRPAMNELMKKVQRDEVGTIIVKDLSRLGRNFLDVGYTLEFLFPAHQVRVIAVNDHFDSANYSETTGGLNLALQNLKNEFYSRDLSIRIQSSKNNAKDRGEYKHRAAYGYKRECGKAEITIDEESASVVRKIFQMAAVERLSCRQIAQYLNQWKIPAPSFYRCPDESKSLIQKYWSDKAVLSIITRRAYTGHTYRNLTERIGVGRKGTRWIPRKERELLYNTHPPIVSEETFLEAQKVIRSVEKAGSIKSHVLKGYLYCGCCGLTMIRSSTCNHRFRCKWKGYYTERGCDSVSCDAQEVEQAILESVNNLAQIAEQSGIQEKKQATIIESLQRQRKHCADRLKALKEKKLKLYECMAEGEISLEQYQGEKTLLLDTEQAVQTDMVELEKQVHEMELQRSVQKEKYSFLRYAGVENLTKEILNELIERVVIYPDNRIEIKYTFQDCFTEADY